MLLWNSTASQLNANLEIDAASSHLKDMLINGLKLKYSRKAVSIQSMRVRHNQYSIQLVEFSMRRPTCKADLNS